MDSPNTRIESRAALQEALGYLNFSSGAPDPRFQRVLNELYGQIDETGQPNTPRWRVLHHRLSAELLALKGTTEAFKNVSQAEGVISLVFDHLLSAYRQHHRDSLFHQPDAALFRPFFIARAFEATLAVGGPWNETDRIVKEALDRLNDFLGHRPVAVLQTSQKIEPYPHEWVAPLPLFLRDAGVSIGRYQLLVQQALEILNATHGEILEHAYFDPELMDELSLDPRAYDFDHPVNKRPNYQFGQWDPHLVDNRGRYRRFVVQELTLEALWQRTQNPGNISTSEAIFEAGAVLAGTILMAAGISGRGPDTHDSGVTLSKLLPRIASYRDAFYKLHLARLEGPHGNRLREEAATLRQPFGGARQHLNGRLARLRATQLQHVHLAQLFARLGYAEASSRQARIVPVASARLLCEINGRLTGGHHDIDRGDLAHAATLLTEIEDLLRRGIDCGAIVDPWNILGFQGQFSLFPALENSVRDHRVDVLIHLMEQIFGLYARLSGEAAAQGDSSLTKRLAGGLRSLARWWDKYASTEVSSVGSVSGRAAADSAEHVAAALGAWHEAGAAAANISFWRRHIEDFNSPKAYALVVEALLEKRDFVAAMALLMQWLSQAREVSLAEADFSFHDLAVRWITELHAIETQSSDTATSSAVRSDRDVWTLTEKFFDYLEANAEEYWEVPQFTWDRSAKKSGSGASLDRDDDSEEENLFSAAYDEMVYRDTASDGQEGDTLEGAGAPTDDELDFEATRIGQRLTFLETLGRLWKIASAASGALPNRSTRDERLLSWSARASANRQSLLDLLTAIEQHPLPAPLGNHEALVEYDRRRMVRESLISRVAATCVETSDAARLILAARESSDGHAELAEWEQHAVSVLQDLFRCDAERLRQRFPELRALLQQQPILYIPLARNGPAREIVAAQNVQQVLSQLLGCLPRLGLLAETCQLISTAQDMEKRVRPAGEGCVTEFDRLFDRGYRALVETLGDVATDMAGELEDLDHEVSADQADAGLIDALQALTESLLKCWLKHSRQLRLSMLEKVQEEDRWKALVEFVEQYGHDLFTPRFMNLGNLRAIAHQGVDRFLQHLEEEPDDGPFHNVDSLRQSKMMADLGKSLPRAKVVENLSLVIEAIIENYTEFKDYNSTTTQSDRGELLYTLLDFLRLKTSYERFAWNIRPVVLAHEILVRRGRTHAAELWRRTVAERTSEIADWHLARLEELVRQYGMRLPTVADRLDERFVRTLAVDRMRALIPPSIDELRSKRPAASFALLEQEIDDFTERPTGAGLDVPSWLVALEQEAWIALAPHARDQRPDELQLRIPHVQLNWDQVHDQLRTWNDKTT